MATRKKKMRKLGLVPKATKSKKDLAFEHMVQNIVQKVEQKNRNIKHRKLTNDQWHKEYARSFPKNDHITRDTWAQGHTAKVTVFDPVKFQDIDIDDVNEKRKALDLPSIEMGAKLALEQARALSKQTAPLFPKGGYQLVTKRDLKDLGKKASEVD